MWNKPTDRDKHNVLQHCLSGVCLCQVMGIGTIMAIMTEMTHDCGNMHGLQTVVSVMTFLGTHVCTSVHRNKRCASVVWWHICSFTGTECSRLCHCQTLCLHTVVTRLQHYTALNEQQQLTSVHYILTDSSQHLWWTTANLLQSFPRGGGHRGFHFMSAAFHYYITPNMITEKSQISFDNWTYLQNDFNIPNKNQSIIIIIHN